MRKLSDFIGTWTISREIDDLRATSQAQLHGTCRFTRDDSGDVILHEVGHLIVPSMTQALTAERRYIWRAGECDGVCDIDVYFDDGRFFYAFDPSKADPAAGHDCDPDRYDVRYDFTAWTDAAPAFTVRWDVHGPRKRYISVTHFTKQ